MKSPERRKAWVKLINDGDYNHNFKVLQSKKGTIIPRYRGVGSNIDKLVPCHSCKGLFRKTKLSIHALKCNPVNKKTAYRQGCMMLPVPNNISKSLWCNVLLEMKRDKISQNAKNDSLIILFGERLYNKKDVEEHTGDHVSCRMRELSRLVLYMKEKSNKKICTLTEALQVRNFDALIRSVRNISEYDEATHLFKKGSLARKLGYSVKKCAMIMKSESLKESNKDGIDNADKFLSLFSGDWQDHISSMAGQSDASCA